MSSPVLWYATRATGLVALCLLTITMVLGTLTATRLSSRRWPGFAQQELHRNVSLIAVSFLALHILTSVLDTFVHIGWAAVVVPFASPYKRLWVGIGTIGFDLMVAVVATSLLRHLMSAPIWRAVHWLVYISWPVAVAHAFGMGTDMRLGWVIDLTIACIVAVVCTAAWRVAWTVGRRERALSLASVRDRPDGVPVKHIVA